MRIGSTSLVAASFVSAVVERLCRRYPRIVFHLVTAEAETLHRELSERNVDLLVARNRPALQTSDKASIFSLITRPSSWRARTSMGSAA